MNNRLPRCAHERSRQLGDVALKGAVIGQDEHPDGVGVSEQVSTAEPESALLLQPKQPCGGLTAACCTSEEQDALLRRLSLERPERAREASARKRSCRLRLH
jgi:hypothetical protein